MPRKPRPWPLSEIRSTVAQRIAADRANLSESTANVILYLDLGFPSITGQKPPKLDYLPLTEDNITAIRKACKNRGNAVFPTSLVRVSIGNTEYYIGYLDDQPTCFYVILFPCSLVNEHA